MKRVAIYARVSTSDQTCDNQLRDLREFAARRGWETVEFVDQGVSGTREKRPALDAMLSRVKKREFDVVLVWRFDRFARSTKFLVDALALFKSLGVEFASWSENLDTSTPMGEAMFTIVAAISKLERDIIAERVRAGLRAAVARGAVLGRPRLALDPAKVAVVASQRLPVRAAAKALGISPSSYLRVLRAREAATDAGMATDG